MTGAVTASTLTTVAVFLPIAVVGGMVGQLFAPFAITVTVALLASLLVSLTVIPVLAYWFLKAPVLTAEEARAVRDAAEAKELRSPLQRAYLPVLRFATRRRLVTLLIGLAVFVGDDGRWRGGLRDQLPRLLRAGHVSLSQKMPRRHGPGHHRRGGQEGRAVLAGLEGVKAYQVNVGGGGGFAGLLRRRRRPGLLLGDGRRGRRHPGAGGDAARRLTRPSPTPARSPSAAVRAAAVRHDQLQVIVQAPDTATLTAGGRARCARRWPVSTGCATWPSNLAASAPRIEVQVDREKAAAKGLTEAQIGQLVAQAFRGAPLGQVTLDGRTGDLICAAGTRRRPEGGRGAEAADRDRHGEAVDVAR